MTLNVPQARQWVVNTLHNVPPTARTKPSTQNPPYAHLRGVITIILFCLLGFLADRPLSAQMRDLYLANSTSGTGDGSRCSNAKIWTYFNSAANWGTGSAQIGAGSTVHICGTVTAPAGSSLTVQGSGVSGSPIVIKFEAGAILEAPYWGTGSGEGGCPCTGAITINSKSYIVIDGGGTPASGSNPAGLALKNGIIQNTSNGTNLAYQSYSPGIYVHSSTNVIIKNLVIQNIYQHTNSDTLGLAPRQSSDIVVDGTYSNIAIQNNVLTNAGKGIELQGSDSAGPTNFADNYVGDHCWHVWATDTTTPNIYGNEITNWDNWNSNANDCHTDGVMVYGGPSVPYIYNNYIHGSLGNGSPTAYIYCTYPTAGNASHCTIFNNVLVQDESSYTRTPIAFHGGETGPHFIYNNTMVTLGSGSAGPFTLFTTETPETFTWENNLYSGAGSSSEYAFDFENGYSTMPIASSDYNLWFNMRDALGYPPFPNGYTFAQWKSNTGFDTHSLVTNPNLATAFPYGLQSGSPAASAGANLTNLCTGRLAPLCKDRMGAQRPATGSWDIGATQLSTQSAGSPAPPLGLTATVQ